MKSATIKRIKEEQKSIAKAIRQDRALWKLFHQKKITHQELWAKQSKYSSYQFRHRHIAYCLLKGRTYEQIEQTCRPGNAPNMSLVEKYVQDWNKEIADEKEAVCVSA
jgi:hypothetical protein